MNVYILSLREANEQKHRFTHCNQHITKKVQKNKEKIYGKIKQKQRVYYGNI